MSASSIQSSADVLLEAAASLEQPLISSKKKKKEKKDKKTKLKRDSLGETTLKDVKVSICHLILFISQGVAYVDGC